MGLDIVLTDEKQVYFDSNKIPFLKDLIHLQTLLNPLISN